LDPSRSGEFVLAVNRTKTAHRESISKDYQYHYSIRWKADRLLAGQRNPLNIQMFRLLTHGTRPVVGCAILERDDLLIEPSRAHALHDIQGVLGMGAFILPNRHLPKVIEVQAIQGGLGGQAR